MRIHTLRDTDFASLFGTTLDDLSSACLERINRYDFRYRLVVGEERDDLIRTVSQKIQSGSLSVAGPHRMGDWERGWDENLRDFERSGLDLAALLPRYVRLDTPLRLFGEFVMPLDPFFEAHWREVFKEWLYRKYLAQAPVIYEFGCGSAADVALLAQMFPEKRIYGFDWARASQKIIQRMRDQFGWNVYGGRFDMFHPDEDLVLDVGSAVLLFASLEQLGQQFVPFLTYLRKQKIALVVHSDSLFELYGETCEDGLAREFMRARNYLRGYVPYLLMAHRKGFMKIHRLHRVPFGSLYLDAYSYDVWSPC